MSGVVGSVKHVRRDESLADATSRHADGMAWVQSLRGGGREREEAAARLHAVLVRAARFELLRRRAGLSGRGDTLEDLAV
ncbi:MAG: hypothetical protein ACRDPA_02505, partial [Solirubrobacteraceae bacterium]